MLRIFRQCRGSIQLDIYTLIYLGITFAVLFAPQTVVKADVQAVALEIRNEATRSNHSSEGRPLPLVSHWNTGKHPLSAGWAPVHQFDLIEQGHHLLPWFEFPDPNDYGPAKQGMAEFREYYEAPLKRARNLKLPFVFVSSQWERFLSKAPYLNLPHDENPNVITLGGEVLPEVSPFGPVEPWQRLGRSLTDNPLMRMLQVWYPDPPLVVFLSNNEAKKLQWKDVEESARYLNLHGLGKDDDYKRKVVGDGWIARYRAMQAGMRAGLIKESWKANAIFVGYGAFGPRHIGRWGGWAEYSLITAGRVDPNPLMWDGGSPSYFTNNWNQATDFKVWSPQIEFMNLVFQQHEALRANSNFWLEFSVWDGHVSADAKNAQTDKRKYYASLGQTYTPQRYAGYVQFGMWLLRPRVVREFRGWKEPWEANRAYFIALAKAVDKVYTNHTLRDWWRTGELVPNHAHQHPYQSNFPEAYAKEDRWFLLDADVNPKFPWKLSTEIPVFSLALSKGEAPERQWLVYGHAPLGNRDNVRLTVPGFGIITVDIDVGGSFYLIDETTRKVQKVK